MKKRIVVFDMDGTLGYFSQLSILIKIIETEYGRCSLNEEVNLYRKECLRPEICSIFKYLTSQRNIGKIDKICIYTNNQGPKSWTTRIKGYLENICPGLLFDNVICAFMVNGDIIDKMRTTNYKTYDDLIRCTKLPNDTQVCFIDDMKHKYMEHENVYYIHVKPYVYSLSLNELFGRFIEKSKIVNDKNKFIDFVNVSLKNINYDHKVKKEEEKEIDKIASKKMLDLIIDF